jgi:hypothetical protein
LAHAIERVYRFDYLPEGPELVGVPYGDDLKGLRRLLRIGDTLGALRAMLDINKRIMSGRGGAAWVEEAGDGSLRVRVRAETSYLPSLEELQGRWDYDYFLRSFCRIASMERR